MNGNPSEENNEDKTEDQTDDGPADQSDLANGDEPNEDREENGENEEKGEEPEVFQEEKQNISNEDNIQAMPSKNDTGSADQVQNTNDDDQQQTNEMDAQDTGMPYLPILFVRRNFKCIFNHKLQVKIKMELVKLRTKNQRADIKEIPKRMKQTIKMQRRKLKPMM